MKKIKRFVAFLLCMAVIFSSLHPIQAKAAEAEIVNVARNSGVTVTCNPAHEHVQKLVDGDTRYRYVTDGKQPFLDVLYGTDMKNGTDVAINEEGYYYSDDAYIIVDLGAPYLIDSLKVYDFEREGGYNRDYIYDISVCNDADFAIGTQSEANWTLVAGKEAGTGTYVNSFDLSEKVVARYVKMHNLRTFGAYSFAVTELEVYGMAIDDIATVKDYAVKDLATYKQDITLTEEEAAAKTAKINEYTSKIEAAATLDEVLGALNSAFEDIDTEIALAEYKAVKKEEISAYKNEDGLFSEDDRAEQLAKLEEALESIAAATTEEAIDAIADAYIAAVDQYSIIANLALGRPAVASSKEANSVRAELAVDGDTTSKTSRWGSAKGNGPHWIYVDLGEEKDIRTVKVFWEMRKPTSYSIQVSNDASNWETAIAYANRPYALEDYITLPETVKARYVRLYIESFTEEDPDGGVTYNTVSIFELEVYSVMLQDPKANVAYNRNVYADSKEADSVRAELAVDGDTTSRTSRWGSDKGAGPHWIYVDLGEKLDVRTVKVYWENRKATSYSIQISDDAKEWKTVKQFAHRPKLLNERIVLEEAVEARYVRLYIDTFTAEDPDGGPTWETVSIYELEVYGGEIRPNLQEYVSLFEINTPSAEDTKLTYTVGDLEEGINVSFVGADYEQVVDADLNIYRPLTDKEVRLLFDISDEKTGEKESIEVPVTIPGLYTAEEGDNAIPVVIPELAEWKGHTGDFAITDTTKLVINPEYKDELSITTDNFVADYGVVTGRSIEVVYGTAPAVGDFYFTLGKDDAGLDEEGYLMTIADVVTVEAENKTGAFWAVQTVMQILKQTDGTMPKGITKDYPKYEVRGFMLDVGRKPFSMDYLYDTVKTMAYYKMNDLGLHLNDNYIWVEKYNDTETDQWGAYAAFRLESDIKKGGNDGKNQADLTASDLFYTKDEFRKLIQDARDMGIDIVPEFDAPAHSLAFTKVRPDLAMPEDSVKRWADHFYLANPESEEFIKSVWDEYITGENPVFDEDTIINIGTDEYEGNNEDFRKFTANMINYVQGNGRTVRMWGSLTKKSGSTPVPSEDVQLYLWNIGQANPNTMYELGYKLINIRDSYVYIVPNGTNNRGSYTDRLNVENLYKTWEPNLISSTAIPAGSPQMLGGAFAIWNDNIDLSENGLGEYDIFERFIESAPYIAVKSWGEGNQRDYSEFRTAIDAVGLAANTNPYSEVESLTDTVVEYDFDDSTLADDSGNEYNAQAGENAAYAEGKVGMALQLNGGNSYVTTPLENIGPNNEVSFWIKMDADAEGEQIIFESSKGALKAVQKDTGKVGYTRENINYSFNYELPKDEWVYLTFKGYEYKTELYVNEELVDTLGKSATGGLYATFVLPFATIGSKDHAFKGMIDEVSVHTDNTSKGILENIALNKTITVSSAYPDDRFAGAHAVDGDEATRWGNDYTSDAYKNGNKEETVTVNLGRTYQLDQIVITFEAAYATNYVIQGSLDGKTFFDIKTVTNGKEGENQFGDLNVESAYIRLILKTPSTKYGYSIYEIEAYQSAQKQLQELIDALGVKMASVEIGTDNGCMSEENYQKYMQVIASAEELLANADAEQGQIYREIIVVTEALGSVDEDLVSGVLEITKQPVSVSAVKGENAVVTIEAEGVGLTYKWYYKNPGNIKFYDSGTQFVSEDGTTYTIPMAAWRDGQEVYCVVTDANGETVQSNTVTLTMFEDNGTIVIVEQPKDVTVISDYMHAVVNVKATGKDLTYKWYYKNPGNVKFYESGAGFVNSNQYVIEVAPWRDGQQVYCVITDANGDSVQTNTVTLSVAK